MLKLVDNFEQKTLDKIERLYLKAFPKEERKPFLLMVKKVEEKTMSIFAIVDGDEFIGEVILVHYKDIVLLDYFAIEENHRGKGYGSKTLNLLFEMFSGKKILLEIETTLKPSVDIETKKRRKNFYLNAGFKPMDYFVSLFGVEMEILTIGGVVSFEEYHQIFIEIFGKRVYDNVNLIK